ncbi:MAG: hypothetical protein ABJ056_16540 [Halioglobus sp.]
MRSLSAVLFIVVACSAGSSVLAAEAETVVKALKNCARTADPDARFKCYDALGQQVLSSETKTEVASPVTAVSEPATSKALPSATPVAVTQTPAASAPAAESTAPAAAATGTQSVDPSDTIGGYQFEPKRTAEEEVEKQVEEGLRTRVVKCQRNREGIWYFKLENGQVWKQVDRQSLSFQGCDFGAVVANDGLGYVLRIDNRKGKIRIKRRQ